MTGVEKKQIHETFSEALRTIKTIGEKLEEVAVLYVNGVKVAASSVTILWANEEALGRIEVQETEAFNRWTDSDRTW